MRTNLADMVSGRLALRSVFWRFIVLYGSGLYLAIWTLQVLVACSGTRWADTSLLALTLTMVAYMMLVSIGAWRCAARIGATVPRVLIALFWVVQVSVAAVAVPLIAQSGHSFNEPWMASCW